MTYFLLLLALIGGQWVDVSDSSMQFRTHAECVYVLRHLTVRLLNNEDIHGVAGHCMKLQAS